MEKIESPLPVNQVDPSLPAQLIFITEDDIKEKLENYGYDVTYTFAGKIYAVLDPAYACHKRSSEITKGLVEKAFKIKKRYEK